MFLNLQTKTGKLTAYSSRNSTKAVIDLMTRLRSCSDINVAILEKNFSMFLVEPLSS